MKNKNIIPNVKLKFFLDFKIVIHYINDLCLSQNDILNNNLTHLNEKS